MISRFLLLSILISFSLDLFSQDKPNVIIILTDDQGYADMGVYGSEDLLTPHTDAIAKKGLRFTQFYAGAPVCSPSRACLLTGKSPQAAGVPSNVGLTHGMPTSQVTIAEMLKSVGYATAHIGKWHLGYDAETQPNGQGFDYSFGHLVGCIDNYSHFFYWNGPNRHDLYRNGTEIFLDGQYFPDLMVREATQFITEHQDQPFFMYFAMNTPHYPYQGDAKWLEYYRAKGVAYPRVLYNAFVSSLDERIGQLTNMLDMLGIADNTIIIFQSDHGHSTEERAHFGGGSAGPYRGAKFSLFEGGIRVPAMISWPGHIPKNETRSQMAHAADWMPTIAELCGIAAPDGIDGKSLLPVIQDQSRESHHNMLHWQRGDRWAVRHGKWKLLYKPWDTSKTHRPEELPQSDIYYLVDLEADSSETNNLVKAHPDQVKSMIKAHESWVKSWE